MAPHNTKKNTDLFSAPDHLCLSFCHFTWLLFPQKELCLLAFALILLYLYKET